MSIQGWLPLRLIDWFDLHDYSLWGHKESDSTEHPTQPNRIRNYLILAPEEWMVLSAHSVNCQYPSVFFEYLEVMLSKTMQIRAMHSWISVIYLILLRIHIHNTFRAMHLGICLLVKCTNRKLYIYFPWTETRQKYEIQLYTEGQLCASCCIMGFKWLFWV